tara:strand:- start:179 stop:592 length:414 start_codon:yes stop_codon:yes gene_type:complete
MIITLIATVALSIDMTPLERAIWQVESNCHPGGVPFYGDGGAAAGPMQVHRNYFLDSGIGGTYPQDLFELDTSVRCFRAYMKRYAKPHRIPEGMTKDEAMARMHNGGPAALRATGKKKQNLDRYWSKVKQVLKEITQ